MLLWQYIINAFWYITLLPFSRTPQSVNQTAIAGMTSTPTTVGLLGHNGRVGTAILSALAPLHGTNYTVVILHRPGSNLSSVPSGIETREIDLSKEDGKDFDAAVKGLHVLV